MADCEHGTSSDGKLRLKFCRRGKIWTAKHSGITYKITGWPTFGEFRILRDGVDWMDRTFGSFDVAKSVAADIAQATGGESNKTILEAWERQKNTGRRKKNPKDWKPIGVIGDMNPIEHWGGIVYETPYGIEMLYFQESEGTVYVHRIDISDDVIADLNWVDWKDVSSYTGVSVTELKEAARSDNALARAQVYEAVGSYHGFSELDLEPEVLSLEAAEKKYGADADAAHQKRNPGRRRKTRRRRKKNVDDDHPEYHRRNLILDQELALEAMNWHGGQGSYVYSLASTAMNDYVSPSMIDAAVNELERDLSKIKKKSDRKELENLIGELDMRARGSEEFTTKEYGVGDVDSGYATWLMEDDTVANPSKKRRSKKTTKKKAAKKGARCKKGQLKVKRKGYTRKDGTKVKGSTFCIKDQGKPGRGPDLVPEIKEGTLGGPGYTKKKAAARHRLLSTCVKKYGYEKCLGKLNYLGVVGKNTWPKSRLAKIDADRNWLVKKYGGEGSFGPRKNPTMSKREFEAFFKSEVLPAVAARYERDGIPDKPARREEWNNTVDAFIRSGELHESAENWSHPKWLETAKVRHFNPRHGRQRNTHDPSKSEKAFLSNAKAADRELTDAVLALEKSQVGSSIQHLVRAGYFMGAADCHRGYFGPIGPEAHDWEKRLKELQKSMGQWGRNAQDWLRDHPPRQRNSAGLWVAIYEGSDETYCAVASTESAAAKEVMRKHKASWDRWLKSPGAPKGATAPKVSRSDIYLSRLDNPGVKLKKRRRSKKKMRK